LGVDIAYIQQARDNFEKFLDPSKYEIIQCDCFTLDIKPLINSIDIFLYVFEFCIALVSNESFK
jgi:hypothetical protein